MIRSAADDDQTSRGAPVIFYQFDREEFIGSWGSHLGLDVELPGPIHSTLNGVMEEVQARIAVECEMEPRYQRRADQFLTYRDTGSNQRIFSCVVADRTQSSGIGGVLARPLALLNLLLKQSVNPGSGQGPSDSETQIAMDRRVGVNAVVDAAR